MENSQTQRNEIITEGLSQALQQGLQRKSLIPIVKSSVVTKTPTYPWISFTITSPLIPEGGGRLSNGVYASHYQQVWSFTVQSDSDKEAVQIARLAWEWFQYTGRLYLSDNGITVRQVHPIGCRDTLLSNRYEHRQGFDVTFALTDLVEFNHPHIEGTSIKKE